MIYHHIIQLSYGNYTVGVVTLESLGLVLDPIRRLLKPLPMLLQLTSIQLDNLIVLSLIWVYSEIMRSLKKKRLKLQVKDILTSVLAGILIFSVSANIYFLFQNSRRNRVTKVVDGDSFETFDSRRIRLLGVAAPELVNCMGQQAKDMLKILLEGKSVRLKDTLKDDYGRLLANVFAGGRFINKEIIASGFGHYTSVKNKYHPQLQKAYMAARQNNLGIFSSFCRKLEPENGCLIKGNIRGGQKIYHLPGCLNYDQIIIDTSYADSWFCSEEDAQKAGFLLSENCPTGK